MTFGGQFGEPFGGDDAALEAPGPAVAMGAQWFGAADGFGADLACVPGADMNFNLVSGTRALGQALARRLQTPRGSLFYAPDYGLDVRELMLSRVTEQSLFAWKARIEQECMKDDRVVDARADLTFDYAAEKVAIEIEAALEAGTVSLLASVTSSGVTVDLVGALDDQGGLY